MRCEGYSSGVANQRTTVGREVPPQSHTAAAEQH